MAARPLKVPALLRRATSELAALDCRLALVGGMAVGARGHERFTKDVDFAVSVASDMEGERVAFALQARGFRILKGSSIRSRSGS